MALMYFITRFTDKTNPILQYTTFRAKEFIDYDMVDMGYHLMWTFMTKQHAPVPAQDALGSFAFYATTSTLDFKSMDLTVNASAIKMIPCTQAPWVIKEIAAASARGDEAFKTELSELAPSGICLDIESIRIFKTLERISALRVEITKCG